ncbi:hypothetical protein PoB_006682000 [Plakobranchus ocellatus]|uniref:Uncharacterized protein n=1 Tax=Plakobranchus ocellatus TaxID=259542 RepID=A0AAV4D866_9GAST|nr:hypothetical protein PoB_006682000 [Plakobranchus ocellatus]
MQMLRYRYDYLNNRPRDFTTAVFNTFSYNYNIGGIAHTTSLVNSNNNTSSHDNATTALNLYSSSSSSKVQSPSEEYLQTNGRGSRIVTSGR